MLGPALELLLPLVDDDNDHAFKSHCSFVLVCIKKTCYCDSFCLNNACNEDALCQ